MEKKDAFLLKQRGEPKKKLCHPVSILISFLGGNLIGKGVAMGKKNEIFFAEISFQTGKIGTKKMRPFLFRSDFWGDE